MFSYFSARTVSLEQIIDSHQVVFPFGSESCDKESKTMNSPASFSVHKAILSFFPDRSRDENKAVKARFPPAELPLLVLVFLGYAGSPLSANGD